MVRKVTPIVLSGLVLGLAGQLTDSQSNSQETDHLSASEEQFYAQSDRSEEGGPYRGSGERRVLRQTPSIDS